MSGAAARTKPTQSRENIQSDGRFLLAAASTSGAWSRRWQDGDNLFFQESVGVQAVTPTLPTPLLQGESQLHVLPESCLSGAAWLGEGSGWCRVEVSRVVDLCVCRACDGVCCRVKCEDFMLFILRSGTRNQRDAVNRSLIFQSTELQFVSWAEERVQVLLTDHLNRNINASCSPGGQDPQTTSGSEIIKEQLVVFEDVDRPVYPSTERSHPVSRLGAPVGHKLVQRRVYHHFNFFTWWILSSCCEKNFKPSLLVTEEETSVTSPRLGPVVVVVVDVKRLHTVVLLEPQWRITDVNHHLTFNKREKTFRTPHQQGSVFDLRWGTEPRWSCNTSRRLWLVEAWSRPEWRAFNSKPQKSWSVCFWGVNEEKTESPWRRVCQKK